MSDLGIPVSPNLLDSLLQHCNQLHTFCTDHGSTQYCHDVLDIVSCTIADILASKEEASQPYEEHIEQHVRHWTGVRVQSINGNTAVL